MKKRYYLTIFFCAAVFCSCQKEISETVSEQPPVSAQITFQKRYGGMNSEAASDVRQTNDGGYIIIGATNSFGAGDFDMYVVKTDASGKKLWTKTLGGIGVDNGDYIKQTVDGGYILGGGSGSFGSYNLIKINASGNIQWSKVYDGFRGTDAQQSGDGGYIVAGSSAASAGLQLINTDGNG